MGHSAALLSLTFPLCVSVLFGLQLLLALDLRLPLTVLFASKLPRLFLLALSPDLLQVCRHLAVAWLLAAVRIYG